MEPSVHKYTRAPSLFLSLSLSLTCMYIRSLRPLSIIFSFCLSLLSLSLSRARACARALSSISLSHTHSHTHIHSARPNQGTEQANRGREAAIREPGKANVPRNVVRAHSIVCLCVCVRESVPLHRYRSCSLMMSVMSG
jgi:hypothetical protein